MAVAYLGFGEPFAVVYTLRVTDVVQGGMQTVGVGGREGQRQRDRDLRGRRAHGDIAGRWTVGLNLAGKE